MRIGNEASKVILSVALLLLCQVAVLASSCAVLSVSEMEYYAAQDAQNVFLKGLFLGASLVLVTVNLYLFYLQKRLVWAVLMLIALLLFQPIFAFGEAMSAGCGNAGIGARYYGFEFAAILTIFFLLLIVQKRRRNQQLQRIFPLVLNAL